LIAEVGRLGDPGNRRWYRPALLLYGLLLVGFYAFNTVQFLRYPIENLGYTGHRVSWENLTSALESIEPDRTILSNNAELVYILAGRPAYARPILYDHYREELREDFEQQLEASRAKIEQGAVYVVFRPVEEIDRTVLEYTGAVELAAFPEGVIYGREGIPLGLGGSDGE
jgi:hypothetical protein